MATAVRRKGPAATPTAVNNPILLSTTIPLPVDGRCILHFFACDWMQVYNFPAAALLTAGIAGRG